MKFTTSQNIIRDGKLAFQNLLISKDFAEEHRLWYGIMNYKWLSKVLFVSALLAGLILIGALGKWWNQVTTQMNMVSDFGKIVTSIFEGGYNLFVVGGLKYIVLILAEVVIFHFVRRTIEVTTGDDIDNTFSAFIQAQKRMIRISIYAFFTETVYSAILKFGTSLLGISWVDPVGIFFIHAFFVGFVLMDNYNEVYHLTRKESFRMAKRYMGVALVIGIPIYIIMMVPLLGTIVGPIMGAVAITLTMHTLIQKDGGLEWVYMGSDVVK